MNITTVKHDNFEDLLRRVNSMRSILKLSVFKVSDKKIPVLAKNTMFFFRQWTATIVAHKHDGYEIHRWQNEQPNRKAARNIISGECRESHGLKIRETLELYGHVPTEGEWTRAYLYWLNNGV